MPLHSSLPSSLHPSMPLYSLTFCFCLSPFTLPSLPPSLPILQVEKEMATIKDELQPLQLRYEAEKGQVNEQQRLQNKVWCQCPALRPSLPPMVRSPSPF